MNWHTVKQPEDIQWTHWHEELALALITTTAVSHLVSGKRTTLLMNGHGVYKVTNVSKNEDNDRINMKQGIITRLKFQVNIIKRNDDCDIFIIGVDDFQPKIFDTEDEATDWIEKQDFGKYTITKIYCRE